MARSRVRHEAAEEGIPLLSAGSRAPHDFESGFRGVRVVQCLNKGLGHVGASDPVPRSQSVGLLTDVYGSPPTRAVQEEARSNDRVVDTAGADLVLNPPAPLQRVPLDEVENSSAERGRGYSDRRHVEEAPIEPRLPSCGEGR